MAHTRYLLAVVTALALTVSVVHSASAATRTKPGGDEASTPAANPGPTLLAQAPVPAPEPAADPAVAPAAEPVDEGYPPLLSDSEEREMHARLRQELVRLYLPLLARPTVYKAVHDDPVPDQSPGWQYMRPGVKQRMLGRLDAVDAQSRARGGLAGREIDRLYAERPDRRPKHLRHLLLKAPRIDDVAVTLHRVQPLGGDVYRLDFDVTLHCQGKETVNQFRAVDVEQRDGAHHYPAKLLVDARCGSQLLNLDTGVDLLSLEQWTQWVTALTQ